MVPVFHKLSPEEWSLQWFALPKNKFLRAMVSIVPLAQKHPSDVYDCPFFHKHSPEEWSLQRFALLINVFLRAMMSIMAPFAQKHSSKE